MSDFHLYDNVSVAAALARARAEHKPIVLDLWSPTCSGCAKLFIKTYPDPGVQRFLSQFVAIKYDTTRVNDYYKDLNPSTVHVWHPHITVMDDRLRQGRRFTGYFEPTAFIAQITLGAGMLHLYHRRFAEAEIAFGNVASSSVPDSVVAEALYWRGVAEYRGKGGFAALTRTWEEITTRFPGSDWAMRADCLDVSIPEAGFDPLDPSSVELILQHG